MYGIQLRTDVYRITRNYLVRCIRLGVSCFYCDLRISTKDVGDLYCDPNFSNHV